MSPEATVDAGQTPAQQLAHDLMLAAAWIADHPELLDDEHRGNAVVNLSMVFTGEWERLARILDVFGDDAVIDTDRGTYAHAYINFGRAQVMTTFDRDRFCTPRIEGGQVVWAVDNLDQAAETQAA